MFKNQGAVSPGQERKTVARRTFLRPWGRAIFPALMLLVMAVQARAAAETVRLHDLIREALEKNPEIRVSEARAKASLHKIPQAKSLADPMLMLGYENEGTDRLYSFNGDVKDMPADSRWMLSLSQMFPYPGKLNIKGEMAARDAEGMQAMAEAMRLNTIVRVRELYNDLAFAYGNIDLLNDKAALFSRIEDAALARYAAGMAPQQEVLMAQTEKYMLLEREEMERQKIKSLEAMLNAALGRGPSEPLGRPEKPTDFSSDLGIEYLIEAAMAKNPLIKYKERMAGSATAKVEMAKKEFYPDITIGAGYSARGAQFPDMWNLTATVNLPIFYKTKQSEGLMEAQASLLEAQKDLEAAKLMTASSLRDNYAMLKAAEKLMSLYREGLIPKAYQDFEFALSGYVTGRVEAITAITRLKALIDYEFLYLRQFTDHKKAAARIEGLSAIGDYGAKEK